MKLGPLAFPVARLVFGVFLISFSSVFVKLVGSVGPAAIGFYRCLIGALILLPFVWCNPYRQMSRRTLVFLILGGFAFAMDLTFWHRSIHIVGVGLGTLLAVTQAFYLTLFGVFFLGEKFGSGRMAQLFFAIVGIGLLVDVNSELALQEIHYSWGIFCGLLTGFFYAAYILFMRQAEKGVSRIKSPAKIGLVSAFACPFLLISTFAGGEQLVPVGVDWAWLGMLGILCHALGWTLIVSSLAAIEVQQVGLAILLQPIGSAIWGVWFFDEKLTFVQLGGAVMTLIAVYLGEARKST